jgi:DNA-directed RNA polymerase subunit RPC12/RpoP
MKKQTVELMVAGYEWTCPNCHAYNTCSGMEEEVMCVKCGRSFTVDDRHDSIE